MQLIFEDEFEGELEDNCSYEEYHNKQLWKQASLKKCPVHSDGKCCLERLGTYERYAPDGKNKTHIARFICRHPEGSVTISLLPRFFAAKQPGTLSQVEEQVAAAEELGTWPAAKQYLSSQAHNQTQAYWWLRRRMKRLYRALEAVKERLIETFKDCAVTVTAMRKALGKDDLLVPLREQLPSSCLKQVGSPIGFAATG